MVRCPLYCARARTREGVRGRAVAPVDGDSAVRADAEHGGCASFFQTDIDTGLAVICDVHRADVHFAVCGLEVSQRPVPALAGKSLMRWIIRQCGLCCQFFQRPRRDNRAVVVVECNVTGCAGGGGSAGWDRADRVREARDGLGLRGRAALGRYGVIGRADGGGDAVDLRLYAHGGLLKSRRGRFRCRPSG